MGIRALLLALVLWLFCVPSKAASPSYNNFDTDYFKILSGVTVSFTTDPVNIAGLMTVTNGIDVMGNESGYVQGQATDATVLWQIGPTNLFLNYGIYYGNGAGLSNIPGTTNANIIFVTNLYSTNIFTTNLFAQFITNNTFYSTNILASFITNNYFFSTNSFISNALINYITNVDITVKGNASINYLVVSNNVFTHTNTWANAPTGTVDLSVQDQYVKTFTPMSITGFVNRSNVVTEPVVMTITNAASTNITVYLAGGIQIPDRTLNFTVSNASFGIFSLRYHPVGLTNGLFRQW